MPIVGQRTRTTVEGNGRVAGPTLADHLAERRRVHALTPVVPGEASNQHRFTAAELVAMDLPEPRCIVPGIVTDGLNLLVSRPKLGKSWLALKASIDIASGGTALGSLSVDQGDVLYLALEDNRRRLKSRLVKLLAGAVAPDRLTLATEWPRVDDGGMEEIQRWIDSVEKPTLIVADTLAKIRGRVARQGDRYSDDYTDVGELKVLADRNGIGILANHHVRKLGAYDILDEVSGTIGITAAADTILILRRERGKHDACLHVTGRDVDEREIGLKWDAATCQWSILGEAKELRMSEARQNVLNTIRQADKPLSPKELARLLGQKENNVKQLLFKMAHDGDVKSIQGKYKAITVITE